MSKYRIESEAGVDLGIFEGADEESAVRAMNLDAGYETDKDAMEVTGQDDIMDGLTVTEIEEHPYCSEITTEEAIAWTGEDPQEFGDLDEAQVAVWTDPSTSDRHMGFSDCVVFLPDCSRACHVSNGDATWYDADSLQDAVWQIQARLELRN